MPRPETAAAPAVHDAALPHLAQVLEARAMGPLLLDGGAAPGAVAAGWHLEGCTLERVKYRPGRNCSLLYQLQLHQPATGRRLVQPVAARLCRPGESARRWQQAQARSGHATPTGHTVQHLGALDLVCWWWPNDAKLAAPAWLADPMALHQAVLPEVVAALGGPPVAGGWQHRLKVAQYVPEHRLCARVQLQWQAGGRTVQHTLYVKSSLEPDSGAAHAILRGLQHSEAGRSGRLCTPAAVLHQPRFGLHWQAGLPGAALLDTPEAFGRLAPQLGAQLAALHGTPMACTRQLTPENLAARLDEVVQLLAQALPESRPALQAAERRLREGLPMLQGEPPATLHGDLHPRNILVDGDRLGLIDLDGLRQGPALLELGAWVADGQYRALLAGQPPGTSAAHWDALLSGYARAGGRVPGAAALAWATAWNLLTQRAWRCVVNLKPGRLAIAPAIIEQAADLARPTARAA